MTYSCMIVDDEPGALQILESYIHMVPGLVLAGKCQNAFEALQFLQNQQVDILFLDIQMPRLMGNELVRSLRNKPNIIFTTAHKDYAQEAFELDATDYLLKPISLERFIKAINKISRIEITNSVTETDKPPALTFMYFNVDRKMVKVFLSEILYIESLKDYVKIFRKENPPLVVKQSISTLEEMLPKHRFIRIHRSFIISSSKVSSFTQEYIEIDKNQIPVGRKYQEHLTRLVKGI